MRFFCLLALALLLGCSPPAAAPSKRGLVRELMSESVALVRLTYEIELTPEAIKLTPATKPFCTAVWISASSLMTAHHCVDEMALGEEVAYVIERELDLSSKLQRAHAAKLVAVDPEHDLAILRAPGAPHHEVAALSNDSIEPGDDTHTMGHPYANWFSYSTGTVAAVRKALMPASEDDPMKETLWIQTTAQISPGNSGGGLFDGQGQLIGICSRSRRDGQGLNFYIHRDHLRAFIQKQSTI